MTFLFKKGVKCFMKYNLYLYKILWGDINPSSPPTPQQSLPKVSTPLNLGGYTRHLQTYRVRFG